MEKLIKVQNELKAPKNQYNSFGKYKYRNCEDILEAVKPLLLKYNLILYISDEVFEVGDVLLKVFDLVSSALVASRYKFFVLPSEA